MAESDADVTVRPCPEARRQVWIEFAMVLIPLSAVLLGDLAFALIGVVLAAVLLSVAVRMWRARVQVAGDDLVVRGTWRTVTYASEDIESLSVRTTTARFWSWAWDGHFPPLRAKDLLVLRFADGGEVVPEATRRLPGRGRHVLDEVADALGLAPTQR